MLLALLMALAQDKVELPEYKASYQIVRPEGSSDRKSWPVVIDLTGGKTPVLEPDAFVLVPLDRQDEPFVVACLADLKTRHRIHPEMVVVRGGEAAVALASSQSDLIAGCVLQRARMFQPPKKCPPLVAFIAKDDPDKGKVLAATMLMKKSGLDVEVREGDGGAGPLLKVISPRIHPRGDMVKADEFQRGGRILDASLIYIDLLDNPEMERFARTKLKSLEGAAILELAKVEIAMADKKYKDAILRCREAARQFAWVPTGERIRKRRDELERRAEVKKALESQD